MAEKTYTHSINYSDPLFETKKTTIDSMNRLSDLIKENHNLKWRYITAISTIIITILLGFFINSKNYLAILILLDILLGLYIYSLDINTTKKGYG